ncbi:hypothetical protein [Bellilinea sp.]|uniref:ArnT family glycosyltransferase n=1 Tax=Bellilinea sp. TaxID=2838785 RepID=UPI002ADD9AD8|nr:hypothetical protein [Bellilinea sp.]
MKRNATFLTALAAFLIPVSVITFYYVTHKPFDSSFALAFSLNLWRILLAGSILALAGGIGNRILRPLPFHPLASLAMQAIFGLGLIALLILLIGSLLGVHRWVFALLLLGGLFLTRHSIRLWLEHWKTWKEIIQNGSTSERWICTLILLALSSPLWTALAPPIKYDALVYHLTLPQAYLTAGHITHLPWLMMSGYPQNAEMLYLLAMSLGGASAATVLGWSFALLGLSGLFGWLVNHWDSRTAWAGCAAVFAGSTLILSSGWGYVDWLGLLFGLACLISLDGFHKTSQSSYLWLAGAMAGMAIGTKYPFGTLALVGLSTIIFLSRRSLNLLPRRVLTFGLAATLFTLPWLMKNVLFTGNPVYPFFFPAAEMDETRVSIYFEDEPYGDWQDVIFLPWRATIWGIEGGPGYAASIGPLLLGFGLLAWIGRHKLTPEQQQTLQLVSVFALAGWVVWAIGGRFTGYLLQTRMVYPLMPGFAALAAFGFRSASSLQLSTIRLQRVLSAMLLLVLAFTTVEVHLDLFKHSTPQTALGITNLQDYLAANTGWYQPAMEAIRSLPPGSRTLMIYEPRAFYCLPACKPDENLDRWRSNWMRYADFSAIRRQWQNEGFTHLLVFRLGVEFMKDNPDPKHPLPSLLALEAFLDTLPTFEDIGGVYQLYSLE